MKIIYMGTPEFAVLPLEILIEKHEVVAVVTQPDRPKGRGNKMIFSAVKEVALLHDIPVLQPSRARDENFRRELAEYNADIIVVAAYGQILPETVLKMPKYGAINIHGSLLPKYRGAAPIAKAIIDGESTTGITIMQMEKGLDTGDMLIKEEIEIAKNDNEQTLCAKLSKIGVDLLLIALDKIKNGTIIATKQNDSESSYAKPLTKEMGLINWDENTSTIDCLIRGLNPWPCAYTRLENGEILKIWSAEPIALNSEDSTNAECGNVFKYSKNEYVVKTKNSAIKLSEVQAAGKKRMNISDFMRGYGTEINRFF